MKKPRRKKFRSAINEPFTVQCIQTSPRTPPIVFVGEYGITSAKTLARLAEAVAEAAKWLEERS